MVFENARRERPIKGRRTIRKKLQTPSLPNIFPSFSATIIQSTILTIGTKKRSNNHPDRPTILRRIYVL